MDQERRVRVENRTKYDIGVKLQNGQMPNIAAGSFITLSADDVEFIDRIARGRKPFSSGELAIVDRETGKELTLEDLGGFTDPHTTKHFGDEEIQSNLKKSANQIKKWLDGIKDPVELHSIAQVAEAMDLPQSKMNIIREKAPNNEMVGE